MDSHSHKLEATMLDALAIETQPAEAWDEEDELDAQWWTDALLMAFDAYVEIMLPTSEARIREAMVTHLNRQYTEWASAGFPDTPEWAWMKRLSESAEDLLARSSATWNSVDNLEINWHGDPVRIVEEQFVRYGQEIRSSKSARNPESVARAIRCRPRAIARRMSRRVHVRRSRPSNKSPGDDPEPARGRPSRHELALAVPA